MGRQAAIGWAIELRVHKIVLVLMLVPVLVPVFILELVPILPLRGFASSGAVGTRGGGD